MTTSYRPTLVAAVLGLILVAAGCTGTRPTNLGVTDAGSLTDCPSTPNCVSSDATTERHEIAALTIEGDPQDAWEAAKAALLSLPRVKIVSESDGYLHAECTTKVMRFVDDIELHLRPEVGEIAVRSASRIGRSDMGVNRNRVELLRSIYDERR